MRSYDDPCGIARGLDVIGERLALLVVRELLLGPKRFTDLHRGLHGASQNVLTQRLRELAGSGVLRRRRLGPPAGVWVYELTDWGRELEPVLLALGRWGGRAALGPAGELSPDALILALRTTFDPEAAGSLRATVELRLDEDCCVAEIADGRIAATRGAAVRPDVVITASAVALRSVVFAGRPPAGLRIEGDERVAARFLGLFPRPIPVDAD